MNTDRTLKIGNHDLPVKSRRQAGISYVELLVASVIIAISVVPISQALQSSMLVASNDIRSSANHYALVARMESLLAEPFGSLSAQALGADTETSYSDLAGTPNRRLVYISAYDADNADADDDEFTGTEADLLWIEVEIEDSDLALSSLKSQL